MVEEEWRLLVDLIAGFKLAAYHPVTLDMAMQGLIQKGLVEEVRNGTWVTSLGYRVRGDAPPFVPGGERIWADRDDLQEPLGDPGPESGFCPPACPM